MSLKLTTNNQRYNSTQNFLTDLAGTSSYYFFIGNHDPAVTTPPEALNTIEDFSVQTYNHMIAGKKITTDDVVSAIRNIPYVANTVYDKYDDEDTDLEEKDFFVITDEGSFRHVYKCLDNNRANPSTVQPDFSHVTGSNSFIYQTSDGYRWKYMYSVSSAQVLKFATSDYFPVFANTAVSNGVVGGAVDIVVVEGTGQKYDNYVSGSLSTTNIRVGGNNILYEIANTTASMLANFYIGCIMYLTSGTGAGGYSRVTQYISNSNGKYVVLDLPFSVPPLNGTEYEIYPEVKVFGTGAKLVNCHARALVNALASNSIYRVEMLDRGSGYDSIYAAQAIADPSVSVLLPAELRAINSPPRGHGYNAAQELYSNSLLLSVKFSNNENNTIPATNSFKQIGIIKDPVFANVAIEFASKVGLFSVSEQAHCVDTIQIETNVSINTTSNVVSCDAADFLNQLQGDPYFLIKAADNSAYQLAFIDTVSDASNIILTTNGYFACTEAILYKTTIVANAVVSSANNTHLLLANVAGYFETGAQIIGRSSGAYTLANTINISDVTKGFDTFVEAYKYRGTLISGSFDANEYVKQTSVVSNVTASALVHSIVANGDDIILYTTQQQDNFQVGGTNTVIGNISGAELQLTTRYPPELVFRSGEVLYYENVSEITRSDITSEVFQTTIAY